MLIDANTTVVGSPQYDCFLAGLIIGKVGGDSL